MKKTILFLLVLILLPQYILLAESQRNKKIGLVLAGGGALGFAHIGVLKVLREKKIPIHIVTGTSMGAIVGAAYASGRTIEEMESVLITTDWQDLFEEEAARSGKSYRLKSGREADFLGDKKFGFYDGKISTAAGVIEGQKVRPLLQRLYYDIPTPVQFDQLPIPFRAVTADIETGEAYVPDSGNLASIVRASMSVPGFFSPVEIDGNLLVDGGIANNLPVDVALDLGADILIVVELYADFSKAKDLDSPLAVSGQILSLLLAQNAKLQKQKMRSHDVFIAPNLTGYTALDFKKGQELIELGENAARDVLSQVNNLSLTTSEFNNYENHRTLDRQSEQKIEFIKIKNNTVVPDNKIRSLVSFQEGVKFDRKQVEEDVEDIYNLGQFNQVKYDYLKQENQLGLIIETEPTSWEDRFLRLGFTLEDDFDGNNYYRLGGAFRFNNINSYGAYSEQQVEIGRSPFFQTELYQPLAKGSSYFINPVLSYGRTNFDIRVAGDDIAKYFRRQGRFGIALGKELDSYGEFRLGARRGFGDLERDIGDPLLPEPSYDLGEVYTKLVIDTLDQGTLAQKGFLFDLEYISALDQLGDSEDFNTLIAETQIPYTWGRNTVSFKFDYAETFETRPSERFFTLGGFYNVSGFQPNDLYVSDYKVGRIAYARKFSEGDIPIFDYGFYAGGTFEIANLSSDIDDLPDLGTVTGGTVFVGVDTPLLPAFISFGINDDDEKSLYLLLGTLGQNRKQ